MMTLPTRTFSPYNNDGWKGGRLFMTLWNEEVIEKSKAQLENATIAHDLGAS